MNSPDEQLQGVDPGAQAKVIITALSNFARGTQSLIRHHIDLARHELKADAAEVAKDAVGVAIAIGMLLMGYVLLLFATVLFSAWYGGITAMALTTLSLSLIHLIGGALLARSVASTLRDRRYGLEYTGAEIERSTTWAKQISQRNEEKNEQA